MPNNPFVKQIGKIADGYSAQGRTDALSLLMAWMCSYEFHHYGTDFDTLVRLTEAFIVEQETSTPAPAPRKVSSDAN